MNKSSITDSGAEDIGRNLPSIVSRLEDTSRFQKDRWKLLIMKEVFDQPGITRKQLTTKLKVRSETVSLSVGDLIKDGLVVEGSIVPGKPGRPEVELLPKGDRIVGVSLYIEDRDIVMGVVNLLNEPLIVVRHSLPADAENKDFEKVFRRYITGITKKLGPASELAGIGISLIGAVDHEKNIWSSTARWRKIRNMDLSWLSDTMTAPISVQRSLDAELEYIMSVHPELREGNTMLFHWGFGVGSAFSHRGQILGSSFGRFGDIGHTPVIKENAKECLCGLHGCLETEAAFWALKKPIQDAVNELDEGVMSIPEIISDPRLVHIPAVDKAIDCVTNGLRTSFHLFFPDHIVLIGLFIENEGISDRLQSRFRSILPPDCKDKVNVSVEHSAFGGVLYTSCSALMVQALSKYSRLNTL